jgi:rubrerythrin
LRLVSIDGTPTSANLREAFAREAQAALRCQYFARRADVEGRADVAAYLRSLADGEAGHGFGHLEFLEEAADPLAGAGDTPGNLDSAIAEAEANASAYADYAAAARKARQRDIAEWFDAVATAEHAHVAQLTRLRRAFEED